MYYTGIALNIPSNDGTVAGQYHPSYWADNDNWVKYRATMAGGKTFVYLYLERFSKREDNADFTSRRKISYCPAHAKAALMEVKNAIYERMPDIKRIGGPDSYQKAIKGMDNGVDLNGQSMSGFIGCDVLPELLMMGCVGVYIDKPSQEATVTLAQAQTNNPYLYFYTIESIRSWNVDSANKLTALLLQDTVFTTDEDTGLISGEANEFRLLRRTSEGVTVQFFDEDGEEDEVRKTTLNLTEIPFVIMKIGQSLLVDVADYQIALLNLASSDINYAMKSNFPFYTEQFDPLTAFIELRDAPSSGTSVLDTSNTDNVDQKAGTAAVADTANRKEVLGGATDGRQYPKGLDRPDFIHPSSEPLLASMKKQGELRKEIRQLINLSIRNLEPTRATAESKQADDGGLQAGLACIGLELEHGEREIARLWAMYEGPTVKPAVVQYPTKYDLKSDAERRLEADELIKTRGALPSIVAQKEVTKQAIEV